ncbi:MAG: DNA (cytosine-5-)-methyltransferase [Oligoflexia bacterium]|nr:DNA (cytosine-5-)-methyltransferase [Oligoflexia bacterium]
MIKYLDLFAGIGMMSYGVSRNKLWKCVAHVENDKLCQKVLKKNNPFTPIYGDIYDFTKEDLNRVLSLKEGDKFAIIGGFPCQNISIGGEGDGILGDRSSAWFEFLRLIAASSPDFVIIENVERLKEKGLNIALKGLNSRGYDAQWVTLHAYDAGLPHTRARVFIIAYKKGSLPEGSIYISKERINKAFVESRDQFNPSIFKIRRVKKVAKNSKPDKERICQVGNSVVHELCKFVADCLDEPTRLDFELTKLEKNPIKDSGYTPMDYSGIMIDGEVYTHENINPTIRDKKLVRFPTVTRSDSINALGKYVFKITKNGRVRRYTKTSNASLNLTRFVKFFHKGKLTTKKLPKPLGNEYQLCPNFCEALMGIPKDWTKI